MRIDIITIFPDIFKPFLSESIIKRAQASKKVVVKVHDLRKYSKDKHQSVDDRPFGGGPGMVMSAQPIFDAVKAIKGRRKAYVFIMDPRGKPLTQQRAKRFAKYKNIIIICGHYEGIDHRVHSIVDGLMSIGDYVLTGGELPALVLVDCITRLIPGVLGKEASLVDETFEGNLLEYPQYTRPSNFRGKKVPDVLLSGNHKDVNAWRKAQALAMTKKFRPDLLDK